MSDSREHALEQTIQSIREARAAFGAPTDLPPGKKRDALNRLFDLPKLLTPALAAVRAEMTRKADDGKCRDLAAADVGKPEPGEVSTATSSDEAWETALEQCESILEMCEELPDAGADFAASVREKVESYANWIEDHETVTEKMQAALDNMEAGCRRWLERQ